jgi:hypothetical protein
MDDEYQDESDLKSLKNEVRRLQAMVEIHMRSTEKRKVECFGKYTPDAAEVLASWLTEETKAGVCRQDMAFFRVGKEDIATKEILERLRISGLGWSNLKIDGPSLVKSAKDFKKIQKKITKMAEKLGSDWAEDVLPIGQTVTKGEYFHLLQGAKIMWKPLRTLLELSMVVSGEDGGMPLELFLETVHTVSMEGLRLMYDLTLQSQLQVLGGGALSKSYVKDVSQANTSEERKKDIVREDQNRRAAKANEDALKAIANAISNVGYGNRGITRNDSRGMSGEGRMFRGGRGRRGRYVSDGSDHNPPNNRNNENPQPNGATGGNNV